MKGELIMAQFTEIKALKDTIKQNWEKHNLEMEKKDPEQTFLGIQKKIYNTHFFMENEKKELNNKVDELRKDFSEERVNENRASLLKDYNAMVENEKTALRKEISDLIKRKKEMLYEMLTTPPTDSQLNLLKALEMRSDITANELLSMAPAFFENYNALKVLENVGEKNGISLTLPVQMDVKQMQDNITKAANLLSGALEYLATPQRKIPIQYHAFYSSDPSKPDFIQDPQYREIAFSLDNVPQLREVKANKTKLTPSEKARIDYYFRDVAEIDKSSVEVLKHTQKVMSEHPGDIELLKLSDYKNLVTEVQEAATNNS